MVNSTEPTALRWKVLEQIDEELMKGDERAALSLVKGSCRENLVVFVALATARADTPKALHLDELKLNGIDASAILSPVDGTFGFNKKGVSAWALFGLTQQQILFISVGLLFLATVDCVTFSGGFSGLVIDTIGHAGYTLTSLEALRKEGSLNVDSGKLSSKMLDRFSCIALAGVATEYLLYGYSEGGLSDIYQVGCTKHDSTFGRHERVRLKVAEAMSSRKSVAFCIDTIENTINVDDL
ncbi:hypothetical protein MKW92_046070 [Papaver armeniacum]|nr:hypothetical protein MKW92_046070 [Papaver armeniacum]